MYNVLENSPFTTNRGATIGIVMLGAAAELLPAGCGASAAMEDRLNKKTIEEMMVMIF
jgi:hypothetical protein